MSASSCCSACKLNRANVVAAQNACCALYSFGLPRSCCILHVMPHKPLSCTCTTKQLPVLLLQLAAQLYPDYTVLQLPRIAGGTSSTSSIAAALAAARKGPGKPSSSFLVILASTNKPLVVDMTLEIGPGEAWALATPAGLQAAADGAALDPADLLPVRCSALADGSFIANRWAQLWLSRAVMASSRRCCCNSACCVLIRMLLSSSV